MGERARFSMMCMGKACAVSVLMASFSNQMSFVVGIAYNDSSLCFVMCAVVVCAMLLMVKAFRHARVRFVFAIVALALILAWACLASSVQGINGGAGFSEGLLLAYAFLGRIATLFANIQWNFHFAINKVTESARYVLATVAAAFVLYFAFLLVPAPLSRFLLISSLVASGVLNVIAAWFDRRSGFLVHGIDQVMERDAAHPATVESRRKIRLLFFSSRVVYGVFLGIMVGISTQSSQILVGDRALMALMFLAMTLLAIAAWGFIDGRKNSMYLVVTMPVTVSIVALVGFYPEGFGDPLSVFAMLAEVIWTVQNLFQLPTYRRMTGIHPGVFPYAEYLSQVIPFYITAWVLVSNQGVLARFGEAGLSSVAISAVLFGVLVCFSVGAMGRHAVRYMPRVESVRGSAGTKGVAAPAVALAMNGLTPREREVFTLLAEGYSRPYIGKMLFISPDTVKVHARHIYAKLGVSTRDELIEYARMAARSQAEA